MARNSINLKDKSIILFTHTDMDGVGCGIVAKALFTNRAEVYYCNYNVVDDDIMKVVPEAIDKYGEDGFVIFITDLTPTKAETMKYLNSLSTQKQLLDHHATALHYNDEYSWAYVSVDEGTHYPTSGTSLFYDYLIRIGVENFSMNLIRFVEMVATYDTWKWTTSGEFGQKCKTMNELFYMLPREQFIDWAIIQFDIAGDNEASSFPVYRTEDEVLINYRHRNMRAYIDKRATNIQIRNFYNLNLVVGYVFAEDYISDLGNELCTRLPDIDIIAIINIGSMTVSYRTVKDDVDCGEFAKRFGGGGHPKAAGSPISQKTLMEALKDIICD